MSRVAALPGIGPDYISQVSMPVAVGRQGVKAAQLTPQFFRGDTVIPTGEVDNPFTVLVSSQPRAFFHTKTQS